MRYEGMVYRPPSEARSLIIQITEPVCIKAAIGEKNSSDATENPQPTPPGEGSAKPQPADYKYKNKLKLFPFPISKPFTTRIARQMMPA